MRPGLRRFMLILHITSSAGWIGAVATSLALAVAGLAGHDTQLVQAVYRALDVVGWYALVPFSLASLLTGLVQSLGTRWGLLRHYWVLIKLLMNLFATGVLLLYTQTLDYAAGLAARPALTGSQLRELQSPSPTAHSIAALLLLLVAVALSVYKPRGLTRYGARKLTAGLTPRGTAT